MHGRTQYELDSAGRGIRIAAAVAGRILLFAALLLLAGRAAFAEGDRLSAHDLRIAGDASRARMVLEFDREPEINWFLLRGPHRLVIDLPEARFAIDPDKAGGRGMLTDVQYGNIGPDGARLILTADTAFRVDALDARRNESGEGWRLIVDLSAASDAEFLAMMADQALTTASTRTTPKTDRLGQAAPAPKRFTIIIDAGHGGIDSGAEGVGGTLEKAVTLEFARELAQKLRASGRFDIHMTRDDDRFLRLDERVRIARQHSADLFISVHADTIRHRGVRGATVYTVSDKASDAEAAALAARENLSDELAGMAIEDKNHEVADILMDLIRRETHSFSIRFARTLVGELSEKIELINNPHRFAGFRVLRAPDVPSVLLELGYLSNPQDEAQLLNRDWRARAIESISAAIDQFAGVREGAGG